MSRVAGRLILALLAGLLASTSARSADFISRRADGHPAGTNGSVECRAPEVVTARFEEQVCSRGVAGYAECHWVKRVHAVDLGGHCTQKFTSEEAYPASRGAFPPYPHVSSRN